MWLSQFSCIETSRIHRDQPRLRAGKALNREYKSHECVIDIIQVVNLIVHSLTVLCHSILQTCIRHTTIFSDPLSTTLCIFLHYSMQTRQSLTCFHYKMTLHFYNVNPLVVVSQLMVKLFDYTLLTNLTKLYFLYMQTLSHSLLNSIYLIYIFNHGELSTYSKITATERRRTTYTGPTVKQQK